MMQDLIRFRMLPLVVWLALVWLGSIQAMAQGGGQDEADAASFSPADIQFFETQVRPILSEHCLQCHGNDPDDLNGGLALISRRSILVGGDSGPAVDLDDPAESVLLDAINYGSYEMPPAGKLPDEAIEILTRWVNQGMPWPAADAEKMIQQADHGDPQVNEETRSFWSFQPVQEVDIPEVQNQDWCHNHIDRFVMAKLESSGLTPAAAASRRDLIRRACYDLTGLPPTIEQTAAFENDPSPDAYEQLIDRLLESPHYGEKWARHWLDVVRYAESNSFERDGTKPFVWRYRDYVIRSFNDDKPYDQFLMEQLAGDELPHPSNDAIIATGYYRLGQWDDEPADPKLALFDDLDDILATTSQAMMGLTVNCARCHDHKIDPIPQEDYYRMLAFFRNVRRFGVRSPESVEDASTVTIEKDRPPAPEIVAAYEEKVAKAQRRKDEIVELVKADFEPVEHEEFQYEQHHERLVHKRIETGVITQKQFDQFRSAHHQLIRLRKDPPTSDRVLCVKERGKQVPDTHILIRGNAHVEGDVVEPGFVSVLSPPQAVIEAPPHGRSSGRRMALAKWITSPTHPLTARVMVNRIWQYHFGRGIVRSSNDFGFQGDQPTHPLLLDYLAKRFVDSGWRIKPLHRDIMLSSAYRMSNEFDELSYDKDPLNNLFWRFEMRRLTAEEIRDSILAVTGRLNRAKMFGPSIFTRLSTEVLQGQSMPGNGWGSSSQEDQLRRSIYIHVKRSLRVPIIENFDGADTDASCPVRFNTTQPTQALGMLNGQLTNREAEEFAGLMMQQHSDLRQQITDILERVTQRHPDQADVDEGVALVQRWRNEQMSDEQSLKYYCLLALNLNEFIFVR